MNGALKAGKAVVTANKMVLALAGVGLTPRPCKAARLYYEARRGRRATDNPRGEGFASGQ